MSTERIKLRKWQRIFVNRSLNMGSIRALGFDMDHTLAHYNREAFEALAFRETVRKFVLSGYPRELEKLTFKPHFLIRGLLVDRERGNLLKVDGHKYVKIAFHGRRKLDKEERHKLYNSESFKAQEFVSVDTFFALSEVQLFVEIVDYMEANPGKIKKSYREVYDDLRKFIDLSHQDGSIKNEVIRNLDRYMSPDKQLAKTLLMQIEAGKSLFLLTNSNYEYTNAVMGHALDGVSADFPSWRDFFDVVIVGAGKPGFFMGSQPFYQVIPESNLLKPHDGPLAKGAIYHGGNVRLFQKLMGYRGDEILYVGDHIYGDIIRSKGIVNWRTMLVVEELDHELELLEKSRPELERIKTRFEDREALEERLQILRSKIANNYRHAEKATEHGDLRKAKHLRRENDKLTRKALSMERELETNDLELRSLMDHRERKIHPVWGELMRVGFERSRFADQVEDYACIYTSRLSNLRFYSPFKRYHATTDALPHDS